MLDKLNKVYELLKQKKQIENKIELLSLDLIPYIDKLNYNELIEIDKNLKHCWLRKSVRKRIRDFVGHKRFYHGENKNDQTN